jgi:uncharacterized protein
MNRILFFFIALLVQSMALAASFDCAKASSRIEQKICANNELSALDDELAALYRQALAASPVQADEKAAQSKWLKEHRAQCRNDSCISRAYRERIRALKDEAFVCAQASSPFQKKTCAAPDENALAAVFSAVAAEWEPYVEQIVFFPADHARASAMWRERAAGAYKSWTEKCRSFACKQGKIAQAIPFFTFPKEAYAALRDWIAREGARSPLLTSSGWKVSSADAVAVWGTSSGRIYRIGEPPLWLSTTRPDEVPPVDAPFLGRRLTYFESANLGKLIHGLVSWSNDSAQVAGIDVGVLASVGFHDGGSAKCSANPLYSELTISGRFPDPRDAPSVGGSGFKIVEIRDAPVERRVPGCALADPNPDGFYRGRENTYKTRVVIDDIQDTFVRPDGTFWLKLSDGDWYRFRRNMTSDAKEIGEKYHVIAVADFEVLRDKSKTVEQLNAVLMKRFGGKRP